VCGSCHVTVHSSLTFQSYARQHKNIDKIRACALINVDNIRNWHRSHNPYYIILFRQMKIVILNINYPNKNPYVEYRQICKNNEIASFQWVLTYWMLMPQNVAYTLPLKAQAKHEECIHTHTQTYLDKERQKMFHRFDIVAICGGTHYITLIYCILVYQQRYAQCRLLRYDIYYNSVYNNTYFDAANTKMLCIMFPTEKN